MKWPEERCQGHFQSGKMIETDYDQGWNNGLDACRAALEEACRRETILGIVAQGWCSEKNRHKVMDIDLAESITAAIWQHLGLEDN